MSQEHTPTLQEKMRILSLRYQEQLTARLEELERFVALCESGTFEAHEHEALRQLAHKMAGTGTTYGFPRITEGGRALETQLAAQPLAPIERILPLLHDLIAISREAQMQK